MSSAVPSDSREAAAVQIRHQIWILAQSGRVSSDLSRSRDLCPGDLLLTLPYRKSAVGAESKQALPRPSGAQARRAMFERMNTEPAK